MDRTTRARTKQPKRKRPPAKKKDATPEKKDTKRDADEWPLKVDGAALLDELEEIVTRFIVLPSRAPEAIALWIVFTYCLDAVGTSPILAIESPVLRCGKTQLLRLIRRMVCRPMLASNLSPAVVFRVIERDQPTLLIDEGDTQLKDNEALRGILNSGHNRDAAYVYRNVAVGRDWEPVRFSTWCPKAIALIRELPHTLQDRSIVIRMRRRKPSELADKLTPAQADRLQPTFKRLRQQARRWANDHLDQLRRSEPDVPKELHDRAQDNWAPLLAIADLAGGAWPVRCRKAASRLSSAVDDEDMGVELLRDIAGIFGEASIIRTKELLDRLKRLDERPWRSWKSGAGLDAHQLARLLKPFGIYPAGTMRLGGMTFKGYRAASFDDAFERYLPAGEGPAASHASQAQ